MMHSQTQTYTTSELALSQRQRNAQRRHKSAVLKALQEQLNLLANSDDLLLEKVLDTYPSPKCSRLTPWLNMCTLRRANRISCVTSVIRSCKPAIMHANKSWKIWKSCIHNLKTSACGYKLILPAVNNRYLCQRKAGLAFRKL